MLDYDDVFERYSQFLGDTYDGFLYPLFSNEDNVACFIGDSLNEEGGSRLFLESVPIYWSSGVWMVPDHFVDNVFISLDVLRECGKFYMTLSVESEVCEGLVLTSSAVAEIDDLVEIESSKRYFQRQFIVWSRRFSEYIKSDFVSDMYL